jgi:hypothetical protein
LALEVQVRWAAAVVLGAMLAAGAPVGADVVCRPNALGTVSCPAAEPRPAPRPRAQPPGTPPTQALDRVRARGERPEGEAFVPARRTNRLGGAVRREGGASAGVCRADTLGNLRCR